MKYLRLLLALLSLAAMTLVLVLPGAAFAVHLGWLPRAQLLPAAMAGDALVLVVLLVSVVLFGRLYCSVVCPLGIAQDVSRLLFRALRIVRQDGAAADGRLLRLLRLSVFAVFPVCLALGFTGWIAPYGIFARFLNAGLRRVGDPSAAVVIWSVCLFAAILLLTAFRARLWCNLICPIGTFLGHLARFSIFRVRIDDSKCVACGRCVRACDKGAIGKRGEDDIAVDASKCVMCFDCATACAKGALSWR